MTEPAEAREPQPEVRFLLAGWVVVLLALPAAGFAGAVALLFPEEIAGGTRTALLGVALGVPPLAVGALAWMWWRR